MKISLDKTKYASVSPGIRDRFFAFVEAAEVHEIQDGAFSFQYLEYGPRHGEPLLFFTGGIKFPVFSFAVIEALGRSCRVLAPVQPCCRTLDECFAGTGAILSREKIDTFFVAGSSWGGQMAQAAMVKYPGRIRKAILANTGASSGLVLLLLLRLYRWSAGKKDPRALVEDFKVRALKLLKGSQETNTFWQAVLDDLYEKYMSAEDYLSLIDTQIDFIGKYAPLVNKQRFTAPVLILTSKNETAGTDKMRSRLLNLYTNRQLHVFDEGGHHPALLHLEEYRHVVENFLHNRTF